MTSYILQKNENQRYQVVVKSVRQGYLQKNMRRFQIFTHVSELDHVTEHTESRVGILVLKSGKQLDWNDLPKTLTDTVAEKLPLRNELYEDLVDAIKYAKILS